MAALAAAGCLGGGAAGTATPAGPAGNSLTPFGPIVGTALHSGRPVVVEGPLALAACRNETVGFAVRLDPNRLPTGARVRIATPSNGTNQRVATSAATIGQVRPVPVDLNRAGYVRQSGLDVGGVAALPRAVVPLTMRDGAVALSDCRATPELGGTLLWIDLPVPTDTAAGDFVGAVELVDASNRVIGREPIKLTVYDLALPDQRNLRVLGDVTWESLQAHFRDDFEAITPSLLNRHEQRYAKPVAVLDSLVKLAEQHRLSLAIERLQPVAKWNPQLNIDWDDFDGLVGPWLDGSAFPDREPMGLWPLPPTDALANFPAAAQRAYYEQASLHFDAKDWLSRAPVWLRSDGRGDGSSGPAKRRLLEHASLVLSAQQRVRVAVPLLAEQLEFADASNPTLPQRGDEERLLTASPGLIFNTPIQGTPTPISVNRRAPTFLRTDLTGLVPYAGTGGDERDVRATAWLAFVRGATIIPFESVLPSATSLNEQGDPNELVWFYPGSWFGVDGPVPSLQLKWLRRAEQDYEYLQLARDRGQYIDAQVIARLLTKPVQIPPGQRADPVYTLMTGTADQRAWDEGMTLLAHTILLRKPGEPADEDAMIQLHTVETNRWLEPQEKPLIFGRTTVFAPQADGSVDVRVGTDLYNARDLTPPGSTVGFEAVPRGWTIEPQPTPVQLAAYQVQRVGLHGTITPDAIDWRHRADVVVSFTDGNTRRTTPAPMVVPVAISRRHEGGLAMNGSLNDWTDDDALGIGPLVRMLDRPTLQQHALATATTSSAIYSAWSPDNFYLAFKVSGLSPGGTTQSAQNFVRYDFRRAWGEDVVQVLVQAVYADGSLGPVLHIACKPNGGQWSERKLDLREGSDDSRSWEPLESGARYACTVAGDDWRGELAIPWRAIHPPGYVEGPDRLPVLLRFNFVQHQQATGTSASWAGPVDHGRDDLFMGALVLRNDVR